VIVLVVLARRCVHRRIAGGVVALTFGCATALLMWRMEWFDVWRHGVPSIRYMLAAYGPTLVVFAVFGWVTGSFIARSAEPR